MKIRDCHDPPHHLGLKPGAGRAPWPASAGRRRAWSGQSRTRSQEGLPLSPDAQYLSYPERIYAREEEGYEALKPFTRHNLHQACDTVLQTEPPDPAHIYRRTPPHTRPDLAIEPGSVAVIPSTRIIQQGEGEELFPLFSHLIALLLAQGRCVYIVRHSYQDLAVCRAVKGLFADEPRVRIIDDDLDCLDLIRILGQFTVVIAARYHAMVHAYKNGVPVLAFSWAVKYRGLLRIFGQERYLVDVRDHVDAASVERLLQELLANRDEEAARIAGRLDGLRRDSIFGDLAASRCFSERD